MNKAHNDILNLGNKGSHRVAVVLPMVDTDSIPLPIARCIALNLTSLTDILNFSLVNKICHEAVYFNDNLWVSMLRSLGLWDSNEEKRRKRDGVDTDEVKLIEIDLNPLNCFQNQVIGNRKVAFHQFKAIYQQIFPIFKDLIIINRSNFSNSKYLKQYNDPESQVALFNNLSKFLSLYKDSSDFNNYSVRLTTILDVFTNSVLKEIEKNFNSKNRMECLRFIKIANRLNYNSIISTLDLVLEFFVDIFIENFTFLSSHETINSCFYKKTNKTHIDYDKLSSIFGHIKGELEKEFKEVCDIFAVDPHPISSSDEINEVPIILKIIENFLQNIFISKFVEDAVSRASYIDEQEENIEEELSSKSAALDPSEDSIILSSQTAAANEWSDVPQSEVVKAEITIPQDSKPRERGIEEMSDAALYFQIVPYIYRKAVELFNSIEYPSSANAEQPKEPHSELEAARKGSLEGAPVDYRKISFELINFYFEPYISDFIQKLPKQCNLLLADVVRKWKINQQQQEASQTSAIASLVTEDGKNKNFLKLDIFTGFSKIFKVGNASVTTDVQKSEHKPFTKNEANLKILTANLNNIKSLISLDLAINLLKTLKENTTLLLGLSGRPAATDEFSKKKKIGDFSASNKYSNEELRHRVNITCQEMFNQMLTILMDAHIKPGFDNALTRLRNYNPSELKKTTDNAVDPVINFIELVNVGDLIQQMVSVFYREELINTKIVVQRHKTKRDFLMANKCEKSMKKFESLLDNYVADGLNISIDVLMSEVSYSIMSHLDSNDFNITETDLIEKKIDLGAPSTLGQKLLEILRNHVNLLTGSIDKTIVDVFQQEIGERFVTILVKLITKDLIISTTGAIILISDLNAYYNFFLELRIKPVLAYFTALKSISQLYLIASENSKDIGKLVVKIGRENGIFNQEEIYEFVTRRSDWAVIKKDVDKIMYGLGLADCTVM